MMKNCDYSTYYIANKQRCVTVVALMHFIYVYAQSCFLAASRVDIARNLCSVQLIF